MEEEAKIATSATDRTCVGRVEFVGKVPLRPDAAQETGLFTAATTNRLKYKNALFDTARP